MLEVGVLDLVGCRERLAVAWVNIIRECWPGKRLLYGLHGNTGTGWLTFNYCTCFGVMNDVVEFDTSVLSCTCFGVCA